MTDESFDVIVVGARVAGATVASLLGDAGHRVLLLDKATFPSDTLSTHFFRGGGFVGVLASLGVLDEALATGAPPLRHEYWSANGGPLEERPAQNPGGIGYNLSVRRVALDGIVSARALRTPGVTFRSGAKVIDVVRDGDRIAGVAYQVRGEQHAARARFVVGADGRWSALAKAVQPRDQERVEPLRALYYRYVTGWTAPDGGSPVAPEFSLVGDEMAYAFPSDAGITCVALTVPAASFEAFRADARARFDERIRAHPTFADRFTASTRDGFHGSHPEESWVRVPYGPGWALVGDASLHLDPWTGFGMDFAGVSATYLAEALNDVLSGGDEAHAMKRFHERRDAYAIAGFRTTTTVGRDLRLMMEESS